jgi:hypothetical protein
MNELKKSPTSRENNTQQSMHGQEIKGPKCLCHVQEQEEPYDPRKEKKFRTVPTICYLLLAVLKEIILPYKLTNTTNVEILDMLQKS